MGLLGPKRSFRSGYALSTLSRSGQRFQCHIYHCPFGSFSIWLRNRMAASNPSATSPLLVSNTKYPGTVIWLPAIPLADWAFPPGRAGLRRAVHARAREYLRVHLEGARRLFDRDDESRAARRHSGGWNPHAAIAALRCALDQPPAGPRAARSTGCEAGADAVVVASAAICFTRNARARSSFSSARASAGHSCGG